MISKDKSELTLADYIYQKAWKKRLVKKVANIFSLTTSFEFMLFTFYYVFVWITTFIVASIIIDNWEGLSLEFYIIIGIPTMWSTFWTLFMIRIINR